MDRSRMQRFAETLEGVDGCLLDDPSDLYYLTGMQVSRGRFWASREGCKFFVDGRYIEAAKKSAPCPVYMNDDPTLQKELVSAKTASFDSGFLTYDEYQKLQNLLPQVQWQPTSKPLKQIRVCKDAREIAAMRKAADVTWKGYQRILEVLKEGISEEEAALEFEMFCRKNGASGFSFETIIAFGENSAYPHHRAGKTRLQKNQLVLIDIGAIVDHYCADMTRVHFFGTPDPQLAHLKELVERAQKKAIAQIRPGLRIGQLDEIVRQEFRQEGLEHLYPHSLGHGIGIDAHEYPRIKWDNDTRDLILQPGMVFTVEPGIYQPGLGGVRWEDTVMVTESGCENFYRESK